MAEKQNLMIRLPKCNYVLQSRVSPGVQPSARIGKLKRDSPLRSGHTPDFLQVPQPAARFQLSQGYSPAF